MDLDWLVGGGEAISHGDSCHNMAHAHAHAHAYAGMRMHMHISSFAPKIQKKSGGAERARLVEPPRTVKGLAAMRLAAQEYGLAAMAPYTVMAPSSLNLGRNLGS